MQQTKTNDSLRIDLVRQLNGVSYFLIQSLVDWQVWNLHSSLVVVGWKHKCDELYDETDHITFNIKSHINCQSTEIKNHAR